MNKYFPQIKDDIFNNSENFRGFWGISMPKSNIFFDFKNRLLCATFRKATEKDKNLLDGVKELILRKKQIVEDIIMGKIKIFDINGVLVHVQNVSNQRMKALFNDKELNILINARAEYQNIGLKRKKYQKYFRKIRKGSLKNKDLKDMLEQFGIDEYTKMIIYYNNLMNQRKTPKNKVKEDENVKKMRVKIDTISTKKGRAKKIKLLKI